MKADWRAAMKEKRRVEKKVEKKVVLMGNLMVEN